jgi:hypothetical protein
MDIHHANLALLVTVVRPIINLLYYVQLVVFQMVILLHVCNALQVKLVLTLKLLPLLVQAQIIQVQMEPLNVYLAQLGRLALDLQHQTALRTLQYQAMDRVTVKQSLLVHLQQKLPIKFKLAQQEVGLKQEMTNVDFVPQDLLAKIPLVLLQRAHLVNSQL